MENDTKHIKLALNYFLFILIGLFYLYLFLYQLPILISSKEDIHVIIGIAILVLTIIFPPILYKFRSKLSILRKD